MECNRPDILNNLIRRVKSFSEGYRQNIAIIGEQYIGKTSLIKNLLSSNELNRDIILPIYLEAKIEPFEFCAKRFIKSALFQLVHSDPALTASHDAVLLLEDIKRTHPKIAQACAKVLQDVERSKLDEAYSSMMDITSVISQETGKRCILIIDEFHNLDNFPLKHVYATLAKKIMIQKDTMYFLLSSKSTVSQRLLSEKLTLLFGNFEKIILLPFDTNMSRSFIQDNIKGASSMPPAYLDFMASFTGGKPFYMKMLCDEIERAVFSRKISPEKYPELIEYALTESIFKKTGVVNQLFSNLLFKISDGKLLSKTASVLLALSSENKKQNDIIASSRLQSRDVSKILTRLIDMDIVVRNGSFYRFKDKLFCFWLQSVYLKRILSFSIDDTIEENYFRKDVNNRLRMFMQEFEKELCSRIMDLFRMFKNDVIQLNGKKHKFISFNEVQKKEEGVSDRIDILATNGRLKWSCVVRKDNVTENEISGLIKSSKKKQRNDKVNRNVVICLSGINENAYLMAKDAKFWVWSLEDVNVLMDIYGKPHIG